MTDRKLIALEILADPVGACAKHLPDCPPHGLAAVPEHLRVGLANYLLLGIMPGSFLQAVISNELLDALSRADDQSRAALLYIARFLFNDCPAPCFGSRDRLRAWHERGGFLQLSEEGAA